jgi:hypothetical protein
MSASPSTLPRQKVPPAPPHLDRGKPVGSVSFPRPSPSRQPSPRPDTLFAMPKEPEDARITGGTRSLERRLLALNFGKQTKLSA